MRWKNELLKNISVIDWGNTNLTKSSFVKDGKYPAVSAAGIDGRIDHFEHNEDTVVISAIGANCGVVFFPGEKFTAIKNTITVTPNSEILDGKFIYWYFTVIVFRRRGAGQPFLSKADTELIEIPLPPLSTQKRIAEILDAADALRRKDQELLTKYDELAQSIFIDMFGDPVKNEKGWKITTLENICNKITDGTHQSPQFTSSGIPFLFVSNIVNNKINYSTNKFISLESYKELCKRTPIEKGNILLTTVGSYGNPAIILEDTPFAFQRHIAFIKPKHELINYSYLFGFLKSMAAKLQIEKVVNGVAQKTLNLADLKKLKIWTPPMDIQLKYSEMLNTLEVGYNSLNTNNSSSLFESLLQKAFKGELDT